MTNTKHDDNEPLMLPEETPPTQETTIGQGSEDKIVLQQEHRIYSDSDDSVIAKAKESGKALKDLIFSLAGKTKATALEKTEQLKEAANDERPEFERDAADIRRLGSLIDTITESFDRTMDAIGHAPYEEQEKLLQGYKKMLAEEIKVINARHSMARRLTFVPDQTSDVQRSTATTEAA